MKKEVQTVCYDRELRIEACYFAGISQPFPSHFHEYYVIGLIEQGKRSLICRNREYQVEAGDLLLFHPGDSHGCVQCDGETLNYRSFHIAREVMLDWAQEVTGRRKLPGFSSNVVRDEELAGYVRSLHGLIMEGSGEFKKEEQMVLMLSLLIGRYGCAFENCIPECREEIERACTFLQEHYTETVRLEQICRYTGLSSSTLLRAFTKAKGVTPYRYLEMLRLNEARRLLEQGVSPVEAALKTGFSDQSHFTNFFHTFIGLSPGNYRDIFL